MCACPSPLYLSFPAFFVRFCCLNSCTKETPLCVCPFARLRVPSFFPLFFRCRTLFVACTSEAWNEEQNHFFAGLSVGVPTLTGGYQSFQDRRSGQTSFLLKFDFYFHEDLFTFPFLFLAVAQVAFAWGFSFSSKRCFAQSHNSRWLGPSYVDRVDSPLEQTVCIERLPAPGASPKIYSIKVKTCQQVLLRGRKHERIVRN